jgi:hypothetical protein
MSKGTAFKVELVSEKQMQQIANFLYGVQDIEKV